jgi:hypothetical protein
MKTTAFWDLTPCSLVYRYRFFEGICCLHVRARASRFHNATALTCVCALLLPDLLLLLVAGGAASEPGPLLEAELRSLCWGSCLLGWRRSVLSGRQAPESSSSSGSSLGLYLRLPRDVASASTTSARCNNEIVTLRIRINQHYGQF